jgi:hypothetical protein
MEHRLLRIIAALHTFGGGSPLATRGGGASLETTPARHRALPLNTQQDLGQPHKSRCLAATQGLRSIALGWCRLRQQLH